MTADPADSVAFVVYGVPVTARQRDAALAAMVGTFEGYAVGRAFERAGVPWLRFIRLHLAMEATNRLLQFERKAGRISYDKATRKWCRTDDRENG